MAPKTSLVGILAATALAAAGCATMGQVSDLGDEACAAAFEQALASILEAQRESGEDAARLSRDTRAALASGRYGPRAFAVASPSGADFHFFVEPARPACLLHLYERRKGFSTYTNNLTWIETRALPECRCSAD